MVYRRGLHSPVRGASRGNTPDPGVHPEPTPPPKDDDDSPEDSKVRKKLVVKL